MITGCMLHDVQRYVVMIMFAISVVFLLYYFYYNKKINNFIYLESKSFFLFVCMLLCIVVHGVVSLILGKTLGYQHFIMLLPIIYLIIMLAYSCLKEYPINNIIFKIIVGGILIVSFIQIGDGYKAIISTQGTGYYSKSITDIAYYLKEKTETGDIIISPQWGYYMQIALLTEGKRKTFVDVSGNDTANIVNNIKSDSRIYIVLDNKTNMNEINKIISDGKVIVENKIRFYDNEDILSPNILICHMNKEN